MTVFVKRNARSVCNINSAAFCESFFFQNVNHRSVLFMGIYSEVAFGQCEIYSQ